MPNPVRNERMGKNFAIFHFDLVGGAQKKIPG